MSASQQHAPGNENELEIEELSPLQPEHDRDCAT